MKSEESRKRNIENNRKRKKYTVEAITKAVLEAGVTVEGDLSNSDNSVILTWPDGVKRSQSIKEFMKDGIVRPQSSAQNKKLAVKKRMEDVGLEVLNVNENCEATLRYKGFTWVQKWRNRIDITASKNMSKIDKADKIKSLMDAGISLTAACKEADVDPVTFARRMKLTNNHFNSVVTNRRYEQVLQIDGAIYNSRLPGGHLLRPDIRIEDKKLIIEVDGAWCHTEQYKERNYHHKRALFLEGLGYGMLVFNQYEIENKRHIVDSMVSNKLGTIPNKVGARLCAVTSLPKLEADVFFGDNHLKGKGSGETMALTFNGSVVCALRWYIRKNEIHISRFCSLVNWNVQGGYSKLLKRLPNMDIVNFVDRRHGNGRHLEKHGFVKTHEHIGFEWTNGYELFNRRMFLGSSGLDKGLSRYWDYGQIKYVKSKTT
jgi:very-short-patch-repair endonuclease